MADSKDNKNASPDDFADDLDAILDNIDLSDNMQDELIDDEDAIDRLLMDDNLEVTGKETAEIQDKEFVDDNDSVTAEKKEDTFAQSIHETDEILEDNIKAQAGSNTEIDDDFLMTDFDLSVDDDEFSAPYDIDIKEDIVSSNAEDSDSKDSQPEKNINNVVQQEIETTSLISSQPATEATQSNAIFDELNEQINQLWAVNESLKQQIAEISYSSNQENSVVEELESLQNEQHKLRKYFNENEGKVPVATFIAIGIAILALLVAGVLGAIDYGAQSDNTDLTELIATLDKKIKILAIKDNSDEINKVNTQISLLIAKDDELNKHLEEAKTAFQSSSLKPVVDNLVENNGHNQAAIKQLLAKVETLEKNKFVSSSLTKPKNPKKAVAKVMWVVNLVSFKQEWYAKRKATEFDKKGIPAEVLNVVVKGENWFRLRVRGFKSKNEATAYAVKVKKTLNLSSVWVTKA